MLSAPRKPQLQSLPAYADIDVARVNGSDPTHRIALSQQFYDIIENEAEAFGETIIYKNFCTIIDAVKAKKIQVYFMIAGQEARSSHIVGASVQFPSVLTEWKTNTFVHSPALYFEDLSIPPHLISSFMRITGSRLPKDMPLAARLIHDVARLSTTNTYGDLSSSLSSKAFLGEYAINGRQAIQSIQRFGAILGSQEDSAVLQLEYAPGKIKAHTHISKLISMPASGEANENPNLFINSWSNDNGTQRIIASFTETMSTFTSTPVIRIQITSNGNLPASDQLKEIMGGLISSGYEEAIKRNWTAKKDTQDMQAIMRIHVLHEPEILFALKSLGAMPRMLGKSQMLPLIINFDHTPHEAVDFSFPETTPFIVTD